MGKSVSFGYAQHLIATVQANPAAGRSPALLMTNSTGQDPECMCKPTPCHLKPCQLVLHRDEITHRDVWRWRTSVIYDACDVGCCHKSLMYDLMMLPVWGNQ